MLILFLESTYDPQNSGQATALSPKTIKESVVHLHLPLTIFTVQLFDYQLGNINLCPVTLN